MRAGKTFGRKKKTGRMTRSKPGGGAKRIEESG